MLVTLPGCPWPVLPCIWLLPGCEVQNKQSKETVLDMAAGLRRSLETCPWPGSALSKREGSIGPGGGDKQQRGEKQGPLLLASWATQSRNLEVKRSRLSGETVPSSTHRQEQGWAAGLPLPVTAAAWASGQRTKGQRVNQQGRKPKCKQEVASQGFSMGWLGNTS